MTSPDLAEIERQIAEAETLLAVATPGPMFLQPASPKDVTLKRKHWQVGTMATVAETGEGTGLGLLFGDDDRGPRLFVLARNLIAFLIAEYRENNELFDLTWAANSRGVAAWREKHPGNDLVLPDQGNLVEWLLGDRDVLLARVRELEAALDPFVALADEIDTLAKDTGIPHEGWAKACFWEDLERARDARRGAQEKTP